MPAEASSTSDVSAVRPRVLLAEDDATLRRLLAMTLANDGIDVLEAADGASLVALLETELAAREPVGSLVVVADVCMPELGGLDVLAILRCARRATPVILITAFGDRETHREAAELGAVAVLDKPFGLHALRTAVLNAARRA